MSRDDFASSPPLDRAQFPITGEYCYLNHAGVNALPTPVVQAVVRTATEASYKGSLTVPRHESYGDEVRAAAAGLMGVPTGDVAFVKNTTEGLCFITCGLDWRPGDRVVVPDREFPSTIYPVLALKDRGVTVDRVTPRGRSWSLPVEAYEEVIARGAAPKLVVTSWIQYGRGWRSDLRRLAGMAHDVGALLCIDAIQGLGVIPAAFEDWGVDFAAADAHKWMLGPLGIGLLYVRESVRLRLRPLEPGWASVAHREDWANLDLVLDNSARRFEGGTLNLLGVAGLGAALKLLDQCGIDQIWSHVDLLCEYAADGLVSAGATVLSDRGDAGRSGIVTFCVPGIQPEQVVAALAVENIVCSPRGGGVRLSPHGYNTVDEIDELLGQVAVIIGSSGR